MTTWLTDGIVIFPGDLRVWTASQEDASNEFHLKWSMNIGRPSRGQCTRATSWELQLVMWNEMSQVRTMSSGLNHQTMKAQREVGTEWRNWTFSWDIQLKGWRQASNLNSHYFYFRTHFLNLRVSFSYDFFTSYLCKTLLKKCFVFYAKLFIFLVLDKWQSIAQWPKIYSEIKWASLLAKFLLVCSRTDTI